MVDRARRVSLAITRAHRDAREAGYTREERIEDAAMPILLRRTSTGSGFTVGASGRDGVGGALKSVDLYAKMPRELAEGTYLGGVFSILLMFVFVSLFGMQLRALWTVGTRTDIAVDHSEDAKFQVNFKVELPALSCEWATVDVIDALGTRHFNISGESIYKHSMGASRYLGVEHASAGRESQREPEYGDTTDLDHYGNRRIAYEVTGATFERMIRAHKVLLVEFHAPWCSHCQRLAPIYEHAAELVRSELRRGKRARLAAALATVDCTIESNKDLCKEQHVQAFPTLRVYRAGSLHPVDLVKPAKKSTASEEAASKDLALVEPPQLQFEAYHGVRSAEDIAAYVLKALDQVQSVADAKAEASYDDEFSETNARAAAMKAAEMARAAKSLGGQIRTSGCIIDGSFRVNRVPGAFYVTPHSMGHNLNPDVINMTHTVKHLSFGKHVPGRPSYVPRNLRRVWNRVPKDLGGRFAAGDEATFYSEEPNTVHEHYLKIVSRTFESLEGQAVQLYEYTFNSNRFRLNPPLAADGDPDQHMDGPMIKFSYDVSPMSVVLKEVKKPLLDWILGMCALLGGVYTCAGLLETFLQSSVCAVKRRVGKIS